MNNVNTQNTQVLMEYGKRDELKNVYTYGNERISAETIADTFSTATDDFETDYYLYDGRGSVANVITDAADIVASYTYDPFGNVTSGAPAFDSFYGYNAEETNPVTGLQYLRARYYDTQDGRFGVRDKILGDIAEPLTLNRYAYVINNPLMYIDSTGEWLQALIGAAVGGVVGAVTGAANEVISAAVEKRPINFKQMGVKALTGAASGAVSGAVLASTGSIKLASTAGGAVGGFVGTLANGGGFKDAVINAGIGAIGGFIGGSVGGAVGSSFGNLLGTIAGSIVGGSTSRAISTLLYSGSLSAAMKAAIDPRQIVIDGLTGAVGYATYQKIGVPLKTYLEAKTTQIKAQVQKFNCGDAEKIGQQSETDVSKGAQLSSTEDANKPYAKGRPSFRKDVVEQVWENAQKNSQDGIVRDPHTGEIIEWTPGEPRKGVWDMGHIEEAKYSEMHAAYMRGEMTTEEFVDWYNDPDNYRPEIPSNNRNHKFE